MQSNNSSSPDLPQQEPAPGLTATDWSQTQVSGRLIIRFNSYQSAAAHQAELSASVPGAGTAWNWVERQNAAAAYPTDFALVDVLDNAVLTFKVCPFHDAFCFITRLAV